MNFKVYYTFLLLLLIFPFSTQKTMGQVLIQPSSNQYKAGNNYTYNFDAVFGAGTWDKIEADTLDLDSLLRTNPEYIYLHYGSDVFSFYQDHQPEFESWVKRGGVLHLNFYSSSDGDLGFGGINCISRYQTNSAYILDSLNPVVTGAFQPVPSVISRTSNYLAYSRFEGPGLDTILVNNVDSASIILATKRWGVGKVIFSSLYDTRYSSPLTESQNLFRNLLNLKAEKEAQYAVVEPYDSYPSVCSGSIPVSLKLSNYGSEALANVTINWSVNDEVQTPFTVTSNLPAYDGQFYSDSVTIGSISLSSEPVYKVKAWVSQASPELIDTVSINLTPSLSGEYSIGQNGGDFQNFTEAVNALINAGVCGPVTFNIASGTYSESITIPQIKGSSEVNTITFQSESGDSTDVSLYYSVNSSTRSVLLLKGASNLIFRNMGFRSGSTYSYYGNVIYFINGAKNIKFLNNHIRGKSTSYSYDELAAIYFYKHNNGTYAYSDIDIKNNRIDYGTYGIYNYGQDTTISIDTNINISFNEFYYQSQGLINLSGVENTDITANIFNGADNRYGIYLSRCSGQLQILRNRIRAVGSGRGIYIGSYEPSGSRGKIINNVITSSNLSYGIHLLNAQGIDIFHNTINTSYSYSSFSAFLAKNIKNVKILNNIFSFNASGKAIILESTEEDFESIELDYNNYFSDSFEPFIVNGKIYSLSSWQEFSDMDANSHSLNPNFQYSSSYIPNNAFLDNSARPLESVKVDFENSARSANPDMGAMEFSVAGSSFEVRTIKNIPSIPFEAGEYDLSAELVNTGSDTISEFTIITNLTGAESDTFSWKGSLLPKEVITLNFASVFFESLILKNLNISIVSDNTLKEEFEYTDLMPLLEGGIYTIGGENPDFNSVLEVENQLNYGGIGGSVTFNFRPGEYNERIFLDNVVGASVEHSIVFQSETGDSSDVLWKVSDFSYSEDYIVETNGIRNFALKDLTLYADAVSYANVFNCYGGIFHLNIEDCRIVSTSGSTSYYGIRVSGFMPEEGDVTIRNNMVESMGGILVSLSDTIGKIYIENNSVGGPVQLGSTTEAIVKNNLIKGNSSNSLPYGIYLNNYTGSAKILNNQISGEITRGIYAENSGHEAKRTLIANNFVSAPSGLDSYGLYLDNVSNIDIYSNTLCNNSSSYRTVYIYDGITNTRFFNNNAINKGGGQVLGLGSQSYLTDFDSDYNNLYSTREDLIYSYISYNNVNNNISLDKWQELHFKGFHSYTLAPRFLNDSSGIPQNALLAGAGLDLQIDELASDIEGKQRNNPPDIGAFNVMPGSVDAALVSMLPLDIREDGTAPVQVIIRNLGSSRLKSITLDWSLNDESQPSTSWAGDLNFLEGDTLLVGEVSAAMCQEIDLKFVITEPNGAEDEDHNSDTLFVSGFSNPLKGSYTIGGDSSDFRSFNEAATCLRKSGIAGPVVFNIRPGVYAEKVRFSHVKGSSIENTITFQSETGDSTSVVLSGNGTSSDSYTLRLDTASFFIFKNLTIKNTNYNYAEVVYLYGKSSYNQFINNVFEASSSSYDPVVYAYTSNKNFVTSVVFDNNLFINGDDGFYSYYFGDGIIRTDLAYEFYNNKFVNQRSYGINLSEIPGCKIHKNIFESESGSGYTGISLDQPYGIIDISNNIISFQEEGIGIDVYSVISSDTLPKTIFNNMVMADVQDNSIGIQLDRTFNIDVFHNTIHINESEVENKALSIIESENIKVYNNVFSNQGNGYIYFIDEGSIFSSDYNYFNASTAKPFYLEGYGYSLEDYQTLSKLDSHSVSGNITFISSNDLHTIDVVVRNKGLKLSEIDKDIDGDARDEYPDLGADEYQPVENDLSLLSFVSPERLLPEGTYTATVTLLNNGIVPVNVAEIRWKINDSIQTAFAWTGELAPGDTTFVRLGTAELRTGFPVNITAWLNNHLDADLSNDTVSTGNIYAALEGIYTISQDSTGDFNSFNEAVQALTFGGVAGKVEFKIDSGYFYEQSVIPLIKGASETNTITFTGSTDFNTVLAYAPSSRAYNYIVRLEGSSFIRFKNISFENSGTSYGTNISIFDGGENISVEGCRFTSLSKSYALIEFDLNNFLCQNISIRNNDFNQGGYGVSISEDAYNVEISKNRFLAQNSAAILTRDQVSLNISENIIRSGSENEDYFGIECSYASGSARIEKNDILISNGRYGIKIQNSSFSSSNEAIIVNNFISVSGEEVWSSVYFYNTAYFGFYHNTVVNRAQNNTSSVLELNDNSFINLKNNILVFKGSGMVVETQNSNSIRASDYNNFYTTEGTLFSSYTGLDGWKVGRNMDWNSVSIDPLFASDSSYRINEVSLNRLGTYISTVQEDIDGEIRHTNTPSIGADEYVPVTDNLGVQALVNPVKPMESGSNPVSALIRNFGENAISSAIVKWSVNDSLIGETQWAGLLLTSESDVVELGNYQFENSGSYVIKVWTEMPNGNEDGAPENDLFTSDTLYTSLSGYYTVGGEAPDFSTPLSAVEALKTRGVSDSVIFRIRDGLYVQKFRIPHIEGTFLANSIVFEAENMDSSNVIIRSAGSEDENYVVYLDSIDGVSFRNIMVENTSSRYGQVFLIENGCNNVTLDGNTIIGSVSTSNSTDRKLVHSVFNYLSNQNLIITNNEFVNGAYGVFAMGQSRDNPDKNLKILNNTFKNQYTSGAYIYYQENTLVSGNHFLAENSSTSYDAIYCGYLYQTNRIEKNKILIQNDGTGIYYSHYNNSSKDKNFITNNFIRVLGEDNCKGIYISSALYTHILHNTVQIKGTVEDDDVVALYISGTSSPRIYNNNIIITDFGLCLRSSEPLYNVDYNNYYSNGKYFGYVDYEYTKTLEEWQAVSKRDGNSFSFNPYFKDEEGLYPTYSELYQSVPSREEVIDDIDGEVRGSLTEPGAAVVLPLLSDASLLMFTNPEVPFVSGYHDISVLLKNNGKDTLKNVLISWEFNNEKQTDINWNGQLALKDTATITLGNKEILDQAEYSIKAWVSNPNGLKDYNNLNDTLQFESLYSGLAGIYTIGGDDADFPNFTQAAEALNSRGVVGEVIFNVNDGIYNEQVTLGQIKGASEQNNITFQSASEDSSSVTMAFETRSDADFIVHLDGTDYISFKNLTFNSTSYDGGPFKLTEGANYNRFENCQFIESRNSSSGGRYLIYSNGPNTGNIIDNNTFRGGYKAIYFTGNTELYASNSIVNNTFLNQYYGAIDVRYQNGTIVDGNSISTLINYSGYDGVYINYSRVCHISNNLITIKGSSGYGIYFNEQIGYSNNRSHIYNNVIDLSAGGETYGIYTYNLDYAEIIHNSIRLTGLNSSNALFISSSSSELRVLNNILAHFGEGMAYSNYSTSITSDYNDIYTNGSVLVRWQGSSNTYASLEEFQIATNSDLNSKSIDPLFSGQDDMHVSQVHLDGFGTPIDYITMDIDGEQRNELKPDIGADEFGAGLITQDIGVVSLIGPKSACEYTGEQYIQVKVQNYGVDTISDFPISFQVNNDLPVSEIAEGVTIYGGQTITYTFKTALNLDVHGIYKFDVYTGLEGDTINTNDTLKGNIVHHYPKVDVVAMNDTSVCENEDAFFYATGANTYQWYYLNSENTFFSGNQRWLRPRSNTVIVKGFNEYGCQDSDTAFINLKPAPEVPVISKSGETSVCSDDTIRLTSSVTESIIWSTGQRSASIEVYDAGSYKVTHLDSLTGCQERTSIYIGRPSVPSLKKSPLYGSICPGSSATLSVINGGSKFNWSTGSKASSIIVKPLSTTTYTVDIETVDGCKFKRSATVSVLNETTLEPKFLSVTADSAVCPGSRTTVKVRARGKEYGWAEDGHERTFEYEINERRVISFSASSGTCNPLRADTSIVIDVFPAPDKSPVIVASGSKTLTLCEADSIVLRSSDYSQNIVWSTGDSSQSITVISPGIYAVSHSNQYGCSKSSSVKIDNPPVPYIKGKSLICEGESIDLSVINGDEFLWNTGDSTTTIRVTPDSTTLYSVVVKNYEGCEYEISHEVKFQPSPKITAISADTTICSGSRLKLYVSGTADDFFWTDGSEGDTIIVYPEETADYGVKANNTCFENNEDDYISVHVNVLPLPEAPVIDQPANLVICDGTGITLSADVTDSIYWSTGHTGPSIAVSDTGSYKITRFNQYGCESSDQVHISYPESPKIQIREPGFSSICLGDEVSMYIPDVKSYSWSSGSVENEITVDPVISTTYFVSGQDLYDCPYNDSLRITILAPEAPAIVENMVPENGSTDVSLPFTLSWAPSFNATNYHLFIWEDSTEKPVDPFVHGLDQISFVVQEDQLAFSKKYNWQLEAYNSCKQTDGPVQSFVLRDLPDLQVSNILTPSSAFSGQEIVVSWEVKNTGTGNTLPNESWYDGIYLSSDSLFNRNADQYITGRANVTALESGMSYVSSAKFKLPRGVAGTWYVFIEANKYNSLSEAEKNNNIDRNSRYMLINLAPAPDLQVTAIQKPNNVFSGQQIDVSWTVTNKGKGSTAYGKWTDKIFFSADSILKTGSAIELTKMDYEGVLKPGDSYTQNSKVTLPLDVFGPHYIHVQTDVSDRVYEYAYNNNNTLSSTPMEVILLPPSDLAVTNLIMPDVVSNLDKVELTWTVINQGGSETNANRWRDNIYLSKDIFFNPETAILIGSKSATQSLPIETSYTSSAEVTIPADVSGSYYIYVQVDKDNNVFEYKNEENNLYRSVFLLKINSPDIIVEESKALTEEIASGQLLTYEWVVKNIGKGRVNHTNWIDSIYLYNNPELNKKEAYFLGTANMPSGKVLEPSDTMKVEGNFYLPEGISGTWYLFIQSNADLELYEGLNGIGNNLHLNDIQVILSPWPDLQVTSISTDSLTATAGDSIPLRITVKNFGEAATKNPGWIEGIYLSKSDTAGKGILYAGGVVNQENLQPGDSIIYDLDVEIDPELQQGEYYIHVYTDATDKVYEHLDADSNNVSVFGPVFINARPTQDLAMDSIFIEDTLFTAQKYEVSWQVKNIGQKPATSDFWGDVVYLSQDSLIDHEKDILLTTLNHKNGLLVDSSYQVSGNLTIPDGFEGNYYLLFITNYMQELDTAYNWSGNAYSNNKKAVLVNIILSETPDLQISSLESPSSGLSGQPIQVVYTVTNEGAGTTRPEAWVDKFYLSTDFTVDRKKDIFIGSINRKDTLEPGESYTDTLSLTIPASVYGNYILIAYTDDTDKQFETGNENNNTAEASINIIRPLPADLQVVDIQFNNQQYFAGDELEVSWTISNAGINPAEGYAEDHVYLSRDQVWDVEDVLLLTRKTYFKLAPNAEIALSGQALLKDVTFGDYYVIVRSDAKNNIIETSDQNNTSTSSNPVQIDVNELYLTVLEETELLNRFPLYYKITIPDSLVGETMLVSLDADEQKSINELYIKYEDAPSRNDYEDGFDNPFFGDQEVIISELKAGTYYLLVYGYHRQESLQDISLLARILPFEIRSVETSAGGNTGPVTTCIQGAKFTPGTKFSLMGPEIIEASKIYYISSTKVFATFDLDGATIGNYDVVASDSTYESTATKLNGFKIEKSRGAILETDLDHPLSTRAGRIVPIHIYYANGGNIDMPTPERSVISLSKVPVSEFVEDQKYNYLSVEIRLEEIEGPEDILRPGAGGAKTIYAGATQNRITLRIIK